MVLGGRGVEPRRGGSGPGGERALFSTLAGTLRRGRGDPGFPRCGGIFVTQGVDLLEISEPWSRRGEPGMAEATGGTKEPLRVALDRRLKLEFHGAKITSDGGLLAYRELDDALDLTTMGVLALAEGRRGTNIRHRLLGLLRQAVYGQARRVRGRERCRAARP